MNKEKIYNVLLFMLIFFSILSIMLIKPINNFDEVWHYNFAKNIAEGLVPYRDFNMVVTPLLSIVCGIVLKITCYEVFVMRILAALLYSTVFYITYKIFSILNIKKEVSIIFTFAIAYLFIEILCIDYNVATLLIVLAIICIEVKNYKKDLRIIKFSLREDILLGVLSGLAIATKQTSGLLICVAALGNKLLFVKKKDELFIYLKSFAYRLIGALIPVVLIMTYLIINNALDDFISYTIKGISQFSNKVSYKNLIKMDFVGMLSVLVPITFLYAWIKSVIFGKDGIMYLILVYGLAMFVIVFPISSEGHFLVASLPMVILILYMLYNLIKKVNFKRTRKVIEIIILSFSSIIILTSIYYSFINYCEYINIKENYSDLDHFSYLPISRNLEQQIQSVEKYIEENGDVKILDASAALYMVPINRYNKDYDMFNNGNFGENGNQRIIKEISDSKDTIYLILKDEFGKNWQTPLEIIEYVRENKTKIGEIEVFDIYK